MQTRNEVKPGAKGEDTRRRILEAALALFQERGFDAATMREIAEKAGVATGAAYYYFASKDAIVMEFYRRGSAEMRPLVEAALENARGLEQRLREVIRAKIAYFTPYRGVLRALLRNGADPKHPISPFGLQTAEIRDIDIAWFQAVLADCGVRIPKDLERHLPGVLWFFQMGVIFFWVIDEPASRKRTDRLLDLSVKIVTSLIRVSALPLMRPVRKSVLELIGIVSGVAQTHPPAQ